MHRACMEGMPGKWKNNRSDPGKVSEDMNISLSQRTEESVRIFFLESRKDSILEHLPLKEQTMEEAIDAYRKTQDAQSDSYGRTILVDGEYIGDVWCYGIDPEKSPGAMLGICIFNEGRWSKGIGTQAVMMFLNEVRKKYGIKTFGAFVFADHQACIRVLEKNGFRFKDEFHEEGRPTRYYQKRLG